MEGGEAREGGLGRGRMNYGDGANGGPYSYPANEFVESMRRYFEANDVRRTGALDLAELERALQATALSLNSSVCGLLLRMHDADRSGNVSFNEFLSIHHFIRSVEVSTCD